MSEPRKGMWVKHGTKVGIVNSCNAMGAEVHYVDKRGITTGTAIVALGEIEQAGLNDIPALRRPAPQRAELFGYT